MAIEATRTSSRSRWQLALLVTGTVIVAVLAFQLWRSMRLEGELRATEVERGVLLGERILQRAIPSVAAFDDVPADQQLQVRNGHVDVDPRVAWLLVAEPQASDNLVFDDRMDRAAHAEFVAKDAEAAGRQYDELLAGPLERDRRLQALSAAAWQARRASIRPRELDLVTRLRDLLVEIEPADLANPSVAAVVASAARLGDAAMPPELQANLLPLLPSIPFAGLGLPAAGELALEHRRVAAMRERMLAAEDLLTRGDGPPAAGLHVLSPDALLWLMPARDGRQRAAVISPRSWFALASQDSVRDNAIGWPQRVEPEFGAADQVRCAGVPGIARLVPVRSLQGRESVWLLPLLTGLLVAAFALAYVQQRRAARRESDAMAAQAQFLTTVTHELKTPLAGIRLLGEMLAEGRAKGREHDYYELLVGESARLSLLIDNVLDLGRLERGERRYQRTDVPLADLVRDTLRMFGPVLERGGLEVTLDDGGIVASARIDRDAFVQALVAVLDNARKYGAGGKRVAVALAASASAPESSGDQLMVTVRDFGPGVHASERDAVFDRFVRGQDHVHGSTPGVGIGLYLARSIARRLGGDLACVAPASGAGAEFRFTLEKGTD